MYIKPAVTIDTDKIQEVLSQSTCFDIYPNYVEMNELDLAQKAIAWRILPIIYIALVLKMNRLEKIQKATAIYTGITLTTMHLLNFFCVHGYILLITSLVVGGIGTLITFKRDLSNYLMVPVGLYLVTLCVVIHTRGLSMYFSAVIMVTAMLCYLAITQYLWKILNYVFLRGVLCTLIITILIKSSFLKYVLSFTGDTYWFMPKALSAAICEYMAYGITIANFVLISLNEIKNL